MIHNLVNRETKNSASGTLENKKVLNGEEELDLQEVVEEYKKKWPITTVVCSAASREQSPKLAAIFSILEKARNVKRVNIIHQINSALLWCSGAKRSVSFGQSVIQSVTE